MVDTHRVCTMKGRERQERTWLAALHGYQDASAAQPRAAKLSFLPLSEVYQLLEPGPVDLLTTAHKGHSNVMTMPWHMMMVEFEPPLIGRIVSNRDHSFTAPIRRQERA